MKRVLKGSITRRKPIPEGYIRRYGKAEWGYRPCKHDSGLLEPIPEQLELLHQAYLFARSSTFKEVARWLSERSGRPITELALYRKYKRYLEDREQTYYDTRQRRLKQRRLDRYGTEDRRRLTKEEKEQGTRSIVRAEDSQRAA